MGLPGGGGEAHRQGAARRQPRGLGTLGVWRWQGHREQAQRLVQPQCREAAVEA